MTKKQALSEGLTFKGCFEWYNQKYKVTAEAQRLRKLGYRAVTVDENNGCSVYVEQRYFADRDIEKIESYLKEGYQARLNYFKEEYEKKIEKENQTKEQNEKRLEELKQKYYS